MTDHSSTFPINIATFSDAVGALVQAITPERPRRSTSQRSAWDYRARLLASLPPANRLAHDRARPYLVVNPDREIASEVNGSAFCPACGETYTPTILEWLLSPALLRAQRWAHQHNVERHPQRWLREQRFPASLPVEVRERAGA